MDKQEFEHFKKELLGCRHCARLFGYDPVPIFQGELNSKILQISQAPSLKVSQSKRPFDDLSGKKLKQEWYEIEDEVFYDPYFFYIASMGRCYPGKGKSGDLLPPKCCHEMWLDREAEFVNAKLIIIIGALAARHYFPDQLFSDLVFEDQMLFNKKAIVLPHPSPLNRKWFRDHPEWSARLISIRQSIQDALKEDR